MAAPRGYMVLPLVSAFFHLDGQRHTDLPRHPFAHVTDFSQICYFAHFDSPPAIMPRCLPTDLYELSCIGRDALACLPPPSRALLDAGLTRVSFLHAQMEAAATLPVSVSALAWSSMGWVHRRRCRQRIFRVAGFCYSRLFADEWMVPAVCTLGPYPDVKDVARLSGFFQATAPLYVAFPSGTLRRGLPVIHIRGFNAAARTDVVDKLTSLSGCLAGAAPPNPQDFPALPARGPSGSNRIPIPSHNARPGPSRPQHALPPIPRFTVPPGVRRAQRTPPPRTGVDFSTKRRPQAAPSAPYFDPRRSDKPPRRRSPPPTPSAFQSATRDPFDELIEQLKSSLSAVPRSLANDIWHDFLSWLSGLRESRDFHRMSSIPLIRTKFKERLDAALTSLREDEERAAALDRAAADLAAAVRRLTALEALVSDCGSNPVPEGLASDYDVAQTTVRHLSALVDSLDEQDNAPPGSEADVDDPAPVSAPAPLGDEPSDPPLDVPPPRAPAPWTENNYENFYGRTEPLFPALTGKVPLEDLLITMDDPIDSKILLPRSLEVYTVAELKSATPSNVRPWLNRYEDPLEPLKSWSRDTFTRVYNRDGFFFLLARVAQRDAQWRDKKLDKLRAALSSRWQLDLTIERIPPRHDWMLCSIPSIPKEGDPSYELLSAALIRLSEGNASYVVRHITPISTVRELDVHIKGSIADPNSVYHQLKKKQLEYESKGAFLGWRVIGVRSGKGVTRYRATFLLDSNRVSWPWSHDWNHPHGSLPSSHNLLDFMPSWSAVKPYACQGCYNADHYTSECTLAHIRLGGVPIIGPQSLSLMLHKKAAERLVIVDKSLIPPKRSQPAGPLGALDSDAVDASPVPLESPSRPLLPEISQAIDSSFKFLSLKLHSVIHRFPGLTLELVKELCSRHQGDIHMVAANLHSRGFAVPWVQDKLEQEWSGFQASQLVPGTLTVSAMSNSAPPPRYFKQVQFINSIISLLPKPSPPPNVPEIVASCHGDLSAVMRQLEVSHHMSVPPYSAATLTDQFSNWLAKSWLGPSAVLGDTPQAPLAPLNEPVRTPAALPSAPVPHDSLMEDVTIVSPHPASHPVLAAEQPAPSAPLTPPIGMALSRTTSLTYLCAELSSQPSLDAALLELPLPPYISDTQMLSYALASPAAASPLRIDDSHLSPLPSWPASQPMSQDASAMEALARDFPGIGEELIWRIYRRHNLDLAATSAELSSLDSLSRSADVLHEAFPAAAHDNIVSAVSNHAGDISAAYVFLSQRFLSTWDPEHTPARLLANATIPSSPPTAEFDTPGSDFTSAEAEWWDALLRSKSVRVLHDNSLIDDWMQLAPLSSSSYAVSPRFAHYIWSLGVRSTASSEYDTALSALRALPTFHRVASWVISNNKIAPALRILPILLEEGLINPGAAAWLAVAVESHPTLSALIHPFFIAFPRRSASVWNARNKFLHSFAEVQRARRVLIPPSVDDDASMAWSASVHNNPPESTIPARTSLLSPEASLRFLETKSKGKGRARSASSTAPYDVADPARIVKAPKASKVASTKRVKAPPEKQASPPVSKRAVRQSKQAAKASKAAKIIAATLTTDAAPAPSRTTRSKAATRVASPLSPHQELPEPESEDVTAPAVQVIRQTRRAVLAAAASVSSHVVAVPPKAKSVRGSSSSSLTEP